MLKVRRTIVSLMVVVEDVLSQVASKELEINSFVLHMVEVNVVRLKVVQSQRLEVRISVLPMAVASDASTQDVRSHRNRAQAIVFDMAEEEHAAILTVTK